MLFMVRTVYIYKSCEACCPNLDLDIVYLHRFGAGFGGRGGGEISRPRSPLISQDEV